MDQNRSRSRTTHTLEMAQIDALNDRLAQRRSQGTLITAADLGLAGAPLLPGRAGGGAVSASAVVLSVGWDGDPEFPYLHARLSAGSEPGPDATPTGHGPRVDLHSAALQELGRRLGLRQTWGVGSAPS